MKKTKTFFLYIFSYIKNFFKSLIPAKELKEENSDFPLPENYPLPEELPNTLPELLLVTLICVNKLKDQDNIQLNKDCVWIYNKADNTYLLNAIGTVIYEYFPSLHQDFCIYTNHFKNPTKNKLLAIQHLLNGHIKEAYKTLNPDYSCVFSRIKRKNNVLFKNEMKDYLYQWFNFYEDLKKIG